MKKLTTDQFIVNARACHGKRYDYSKSVYTRAVVKIKISCKIHGEFEQRPDAHIRGAGCPGCGKEVIRAKVSISNRSNTKEFVLKAKAMHGTKYKYASSEYVDFYTKLEIECKSHGIFLQSPNVHLNNHGCPKCGNNTEAKLLAAKSRILTDKARLARLKSRSTTTEWILKAKEVHGEKYTYNKSIYVTSVLPIVVTCVTHGDFNTIPRDILTGQGCAQCGLESTKAKLRADPIEWMRKAKEIHKGVYDYSNCVYTNASTRVNLSCKAHGNFTVNPRQHLKGTGCPECTSTRYSKISIKWIKEYAHSRRLKNIKHGQNGGEHHIPGTKFRVDGFHAASNTILEFHGDAFHGNPKVFKPNDRPHPFSTKTARELYLDTKARENVLRKLGYNVVVMWESEYRKSI